MKETRFIDQNKEKWLESENLLKTRTKDPEKLANLFTQVIDDLSFSRTYYPNRSVRVYLNRIGREYFNIIYSHKKEKRNRFMAFWMDELPQIVWNARKQLIISLVVFLLAIGVGVFSSMNDPQFAASILGNDYVEMTKANIESGDPMAVYKSSNQVDMFLGITVNNVKVAFITYVFGVFFSLGTLVVLLQNGIMVGCFQYFFVERDLFVQSALSIWLHGTLEISCIIIAGGAGLVLGSGLIFPGTYSRMQAFQMSAIRSMKLMLGITPIIIVAGIIESFLTRYTDVGDGLKLLLIVLSAMFIIGYFVVYPWSKARRGFDRPLEEAKLPPTNNDPITYDRIKSNAEILKDSFVYFKRFLGKLFGWVAVVTLAMCIIDLFVGDFSGDTFNIFEFYKVFTESLFHVFQTDSPGMVLTHSIGTAFIIYRVIMYIDADAKKIPPRRYNVLAIAQTVAICLLFFYLLYALDVMGGVLATVIFFALLLLAFVQHFESINIFSATARTFSLLGQDFPKVLGIQVIVLLLLFAFLAIFSAPVLYFNMSIVEWNFSDDDKWTKAALDFVESYIKLLAFNLTLPILVASASMLYFSLREISTAEQLRNAIQMIGTRNMKRGK
jgi:uncharacterized membrane protein SpoIIM required for sporulation